MQLLLSLNRTAVPSFALTEAQFEAHRYWEPLFGDLNVSTPPKHFPIADGLAIGSSDLIAWRLALQGMKQFGVSSVHMSKETAVRKLAEELGMGISSGVYNPPLGFADTVCTTACKQPFSLGCVAHTDGCGTGRGQKCDEDLGREASRAVSFGTVAAIRSGYVCHRRRAWLWLAVDGGQR